MSLDAMATLRNGGEKEDLTLMLAVLCHDFGKASTTRYIDGKIRSLGHEEAGLAPTKSFLERLTNEQRLVESILPLVLYHLRPTQLYTQHSKSAAVRRLAVKVNIKQLILVAKADHLGRITNEAPSEHFPAGAWLEKKAAKLHVLQTAPTPLLQGRDLIKQGLTPSKQFKTILQAGFEAQLEGLFHTKKEAQAWLTSFLEKE